MVADIAIRNIFGRVHSISCRFGGQTNYTGYILDKYYSKRSDVKSLINLGDLILLGATTENPKGKKNTYVVFKFCGLPIYRYTLTYHREKKEKKNIRKCSYNYWRNHLYGDVSYIYDTRDSTWYFVPNGAKSFPQYIRLNEKIQSDIRQFHNDLTR